MEMGRQRVIITKEGISFSLQKITLKIYIGEAL